MKDRVIRFCVPIFSVIFGLLFMVNLSPLFRGLYVQDSSLFLVLGKAVASGSVPYNDIFDHKGPVLYLLQSLGWIIGGGSTYFAQCFTFLIEIVCLWISLDRVYCTCRLWLNEKKSILILCFTMIFVCATYGLGNINEEYCVPWIAECVYLVCRSQKKHDVNRNLMLLFFGFACAFVFMIRANNVALIVGGGLYLFLEDVLDQRWKRLFQDCCWGIVGALLVVLPVCIYLYLHGALQTMWDASITYNFHVVQAYTENRFIVKLLKALPAIWALMVALLGEQERKAKLFLACMAVVACPCVIIGSGYWHYYAIIIPLISLSLIYSLNSGLNKYRFFVLMSMCCLCAVIYGRNLIMNTRYSMEAIQQRDYYAYRNQQLKELINSIPLEEQDDLMTYNAEGEYYLETDTIPNYKYFTLQSSMSNADSFINEEWNREFEKRKPKWLVFNYGKSCNNLVLGEAITASYELVNEYYTYGVYKRAE